MSGSSDDPHRTRGAVRPPPSSAPGDVPETVDVPRMEPPPPSLEALLTTTGRLRRKPAAAPPASKWLWVVVALVTAAVTAYVLR